MSRRRREDLLSPKAMGDFIVRIADEFGLENPHVVGPDIGTGGRRACRISGAGAAEVSLG